MTTELAVELCRSAVLMAVTIGGPVLLTALAISLVVGLLQSVTQLHDQTLSFVPKLIVVSIVILFLLPWGLTQVTDYAEEMIRRIPSHF